MNREASFRKGMKTMELPIQAPPVCRELLGDQASVEPVDGVEAAQSACDGLTGLAQQICYALKYGIST
jgi:hypothetical protein